MICVLVCMLNAQHYSSLPEVSVSVVTCLHNLDTDAQVRCACNASTSVARRSSHTAGEASDYTKIILLRGRDSCEKEGVHTHKHTHRAMRSRRFELRQPPDGQ
jgi:hypothetical protein